MRGADASPISEADALLLARSAFPCGPDAAAGTGPALDALRRAHAAWLGPDLERVHPSWIVRALKDESEAARRAIVAGLVGEVADAVRSGLGLSADDLIPDGAPDAEAVAVAASLWSERLVGGPPPGPDEPAIVRVIAGLDRVERRRVLNAIGRAKRAFAPADPTPIAVSAGPGPRDDPAPTSGRADRGLVERARKDVVAAGGASAPAVTLALFTVGRLLAPIEPTRARWALQHLPYEVAKWSRAATVPEPGDPQPSDLLDWEASILIAALGPAADAGGPE